MWPVPAIACEISGLAQPSPSPGEKDAGDNGPIEQGLSIMKDLWKALRLEQATWVECLELHAAGIVNLYQCVRSQVLRLFTMGQVMIE